MIRFRRFLLIALLAGCMAGVADKEEAKPEAAAAKRAGAPLGVEVLKGFVVGGGATGFVPFDEIWVIEKADVDVAVAQAADVPATEPRGGELRAKIDEQTEVPLPLEHTDVKAEISLHVGSVRVIQRYHNPYDSKIEAVYVFPLPQDAAVTDFVMQIGERRIRGIIREREEAERIYEAAKQQGYTASLLTQERPNIFTQSVANIEPGKRIDVEIAYFHTLRYEDGAYEFVFPMVVGPRFNPPGSTGGVGAVPRGQSGTSGQATEVPYLAPSEYSRHLVSLEVELDAGFPIGKLESPSHAIDVAPAGEGRARIVLSDVDNVPNRDFVLRYRVASDAVNGAVLTTRDDEGGYFTLMLQPPRTLADVRPLAREMVFVVDCSGSMSGEPLATCKRAIRRCLKRLGRNDTFQVIRFSTDASTLGDRPVPATPANIRKGLRYVDSLEASGGTMMITGIRAALSMSRDSERLRIVSFMTDGYIGNETDILAEIKQRVGNARIFSFGIGSSVNRYLLERMAGVGRGVATYVGTDESSERAVDGLYRRVESPAMTDLEIDWGGLAVSDVQPARLPDLFVGRPVVVTGRFKGAGAATVRVRGKAGTKPVEVAVPVSLEGRSHPALAKVWARRRIMTLSDRMAWEPGVEELRNEITQLALRHNLVSAFTAFVAVDSSRRTEGSEGTTVPVAVPVPQGTKYSTTVK